MAVKVGGADGGYTKKKSFKIKDGDNVYRILPSLGFNGKEPDGKWSIFHRVHFGYKNAEGKMRVFESPLEKNKEKMVTKPDAALERIDNLKAALEKAKKEGNQAVFDRLTPLVSTNKPIYNLDSNHHMNVIAENGEIGTLKLRHRGKLALDAVIASLRKRGIEPLGVETGRYFIINRAGSALDTVYTVTVKTRSINVPGVGDVNQDIVHVLTPEIINRLEAEASDLHDLYVKPTSEEVAQIVAASELSTGKCPIIEDILKRKGAAESMEGDEPDGDEPSTTQASAASAPATTTTQTTQTFATPAAAQAAAAAPAQTAPQSLSQPTAGVTIGTPTATKAAPPVTEMSDEEFLRSLGG